MTDSDGCYQLRARPGNYRLIVSFIGTETQSQTVQVEEDRTLTLPDIMLEESAAQLQEVVISARKNNPLADKESGYVARMPLKNLENPQVYNVISHELMQQQMIVSFDDALKNAPGVDKLWSSTGRGGDGAGYFSMRGFSVQPTIRNGIAGLTNGSPDPANIERIETIKGPSGTLFGSSLVSFGGLINIVTKQPYDTFGGTVAYMGGGYGLNRVTADVNTPLNREKTLLFRANAAYHYEGSFQDAGFRKSLFLAPSLSYQVNNRLSVLLDGEFYQS
jgi:iron complex outermembrane receptor protein